jgi:GxxExxY protein
MNAIATPIAEEVEELGHVIIGCAMAVHRWLGPGFKEIIYNRALCLERGAHGVSYECEKRILVPYKEWKIDGHRIDLIVGGLVIVELKAVPRRPKFIACRCFRT